MSRAANEVESGKAVRIGLISDTHGLLRPEAIAFLRGCDHIVHGGDIGHARILDELCLLAPVTAVRGNNDTGAWADHLPETALLEIGRVGIHVIHDLAQLGKGIAANVKVVVAGHSHKPLVEERDHLLYVNPGSAGPRRFRLPVSVGELLVVSDAVSARTITLDIAEASAKRG